MTLTLRERTEAAAKVAGALLPPQVAFIIVVAEHDAADGLHLVSIGSGPNGRDLPDAIARLLLRDAADNVGRGT